VGGTCGTRGGGETCLLGFGLEARSKRSLERPKHRWEDKIKLDLGEKGVDGANLMQLAQDRVQWGAFVNMVMKLRIS